MGSISSELPWMKVKGELPFADEVEVAGDQARRSPRLGRNAAKRGRRLLHERMLELKKNPPIRGDHYDEEEAMMDEEEEDEDEMRGFRSWWELTYGGSHGSFEDNTQLGPMRYTEGVIPKYACCEIVLQIFSVQVTELKGLKWPLHVYGHVAIRDTLDHNRNLLFKRKRSNCQILTQQDSCLLLTGPSRAAVIIDPVMFEVDLKVKGESESEDEVFSLLIFEQDGMDAYTGNQCVTRKCFSSKLSTLEFKYATLLGAVEATVVCAKVVDGSWLDHYRGRIVCCTASASTQDIVLLDSRDGRIPVTADGEIELSRSVVAVELTGQLIFRVVASQMGDNTDVVTQAATFFTPTVGGKSRGTCDLGFCKVEITVDWSLFSAIEDLRLQGIFD